ncbi:DUF4248 domain-containing protein [Parabacteroides distasonis]|uniref:DUF4248 domain-containing protein n=1 Tax=Parabacteroides distasonis TaxID=823 RepID=A0A5C6KNP7_PARDI|nr:DUF4248 domain-containing protein [Parabacteroides distasonis]TWV63478.1 DUF4248 domain-containing protein [Parabacteroides distasonis]
MTILKTRDLALAYFPDDKPKTAQQKLAGWMRVDLLRRKLELLGWKPNQKVLTPKQVACIIEHVGEPEWECLTFNRFNDGK